MHTPSMPPAGKAGYLAVQPGEQLRIAREARGMTLEQVTAELRILPRLLQALEADNYVALPEPGFVRGYIRQYARLLQLPEEDIILRFDEAYQAQTGHPPPEGLQNNPMKMLGPLIEEAAPAMPIRWRRFLAIPLLLLVLGGVGWQCWLYVKNGSFSTAANRFLLFSGSLFSSAPPAPDVAPPASTTVLLPNTASTRVSEDALELRINGDTEVTVRDATGRELAQGAKKAGDLLLLNGASPFSIELSQATAVQLSFNGQPIDLSPYIINGAANFRLSR